MYKNVQTSFQIHEDHSFTILHDGVTVSLFQLNLFSSICRFRSSAPFSICAAWWLRLIRQEAKGKLQDWRDQACQRKAFWIVLVSPASTIVLATSAPNSPIRKECLPRHHGGATNPTALQKTANRYDASLAAHTDFTKQEKLKMYLHAIKKTSTCHT